MLSDCTITTCAKFVVAGEHAVLRNCSALAYPLPSLQLSLTYQQQSSPLHATFTGKHGDTLQLLFWGTLENALQYVGKSLTELHGQFTVHTDIPIGVNLGASAALCVALTKWICAQHWIDANHTTLAKFATHLEHLFHGESSGMDIATILAEQPILFTRNAQPQWQPVQTTWQPHWYLSSCGQRGITADSIQQVKQLHLQDPKHAAAIDALMQKSVTQAYQALQLSEAQGFSQLCDAMQHAADCFKQWQLIPDGLANHMDWLMKQGASAVKPTGAGNGGYVLSLWQQPPTDETADLLLPVTKMD